MKNRKGFTLIELIISLAIFSLLLGSIYYALGVGLRTWRKMQRETAHLQIAQMILRQISADVRAAKKVIFSSSSELKLELRSDTIGYSMANQKVKRVKSNSSAYLTIENEIQKLSFSYPTVSLVGIQVDNFETVISLRNR